MERSIKSVLSSTQSDRALIRKRSVKSRIVRNFSSESREQTLNEMSATRCSQSSRPSIIQRKKYRWQFYFRDTKRWLNIHEVDVIDPPDVSCLQRGGCIFNSFTQLVAGRTIRRNVSRLHLTRWFINPSNGNAIYRPVVQKNHEKFQLNSACTFGSISAICGNGIPSANFTGSSVTTGGIVRNGGCH